MNLLIKSTAKLKKCLPARQMTVIKSINSKVQLSIYLVNVQDHKYCRFRQPYMTVDLIQKYNCQYI
jgi:hypothetical protein